MELFYGIALTWTRLARLFRDLFKPPPMLGAFDGRLVSKTHDSMALASIGDMITSTMLSLSRIIVSTLYEVFAAIEARLEPWLTRHLTAHRTCTESKA